MNIDNIRPVTRPGKFDTNHQLAAMMHGKRLTRAQVARLLGLKRHHIDHWLAPNPRAPLPPHVLQQLKDILNDQ